MFKLRSIAARLILAISLTVAAACAILGTFSIMQQRALTRLALEQQLKLQYDSVIAAIDYEGRAAMAVSSVVAALPPVAAAIEKGDRDAHDRAARRSPGGTEGAGHAAFNLHAAAGNDLSAPARSQSRSATTSRRAASPWWKSNRTGKPIVGVEMGRDTLSIFAMTPIMRDGKSARHRRKRRPVRQGIRRSRQAALRRRSRRAFVRRQGTQASSPRPSAMPWSPRRKS